jgi:anti-anti-sigma factor
MEITRIGKIDIVSLVERVDSDSAGPLEKTLNNLVATGSNVILCDFSATAYISSAGLRVLLSVTKNLVRSQGRLAICSLRPNVMQIFTVAGINQVIPVYPTRDEAIRKLSGKPGS